MKKKFVVSTLSVLIGFISASIVASIAWFSGVKPITSLTGNIAGAAYAGFFHSGDGTINAPFEITAPEHYKNLITLQNENESFAKTEYYFRFGSKKLYEGQEGSNYEFYGLNADKSVNYQSGTSTTVLDLGSMRVNPIGTPEKPFIGHILGSDLTVSDFIVDGEGFTDIGIFGYVGDKGTCSNAYFNDFIIDAGDNSVAYSEVEGDDTNPLYDHIAHGKQNHEDTAYIGYLAGHAKYAGNFTNCYVNDCGITGKNAKKNNLNNYGYFGVADHDANTGAYGGGSHYEFTLNSKAVYNYLNSRYNDISGTPMRLRDSGIDSENQINNALYKQNDQSTAEYPLSNALKTGGDLLSGRGYDLVGKGPSTDNQSQPISYSLSTLGYYGAEYQVNTYEAENLYYKKGNEYLELPATAEQFDYLKEVNKEKTDIIYFNDKLGANGEWQYAKQQRYITIKLPNTFTINSTWAFGNEYKSEEGRVTVNVYIDDATTDSGVITHTFSNLHEECGVKNSSTATITTSGCSFDIPLYPGKHYVCASITGSVIRYDGATRSDSASYDITRTNEGTQWRPNYSYHRTEISNVASNPTLTLTTTSYGSNINNSAQNADYTVVDNTNGPFGIYTAKSADAKLTYANAELNPNIFYKYDVEGNQTGIESYHWSAVYYVKEPIPGTEKIHYLTGTDDYETDEAQIAENENNEIFKSGYRYNNIDVVGGDINFANNVITVRGSTNRQQMSPTITSSDINKKFYATKYASNSIVLYLKNVGGSRPDDILGNITFQYTLSAFGTVLKDPVFRGANGSSDIYDMENIDDQYPEDYDYKRDGMNRTVTLNVRRQLIKNCAYCALDNDGKILCGYSSNGEEIGASGVKEGNIDTYVLIFAVHNAASYINTRITSISFSYDAINGFGGSFGSVGYRDAKETIESTILNFYVFFDSAKDYSYSLYVNYDSASKIYYVNYLCSDESATINLFLYQTTGNPYKIIYNQGDSTEQTLNGSAKGLLPKTGYTYTPTENGT